METKILRALRGAVSSANTADDITKNTIKLYDALMSTNSLSETDIVSLFFSVTQDLDALNPAAALRSSGRAEEVAMMVFQEAAVRGSLPNIIRILVHCYMDASRPVRHIYTGGAEKLRPDRAG